MARHFLALNLALLITGACTQGADKAPRSLIISIPSEPSLAGQSLIHGHGDTRLDPTPPDAMSLARAMHQCGRPRFQILRDGPHWEAVATNSDENDKNLLHCIAARVSFDFTADYTGNHAITSMSKFERVTGI